ncbi:hypothetical protein [Salipiger thiooxidans]|uniref:hypothetical protein n=1 Tax=Salipiger thiooxidans TaxID=282683 RepID=UPI001CD7EC2C|nr:hypothetical protein [Salipiger thiooxidans]MCA0845777.1 hypothetical protein [Salipiger thiooxidans]
MIDPVESRFFRSLQTVVAGDEAVDPACRAAIDRAVETGAPLDLRAAREHVDALPAAQRDRILAQVHRAMAADLASIWDLLPNAPGTGRPN